jgi:hypothetical protein
MACDPRPGRIRSSRYDPTIGPLLHSQTQHDADPRDTRLAKLVARKRNEHDGRRLVLDATPKAIALIHKVAPQSNAIYQALEKELGPIHNTINDS